MKSLIVLVALLLCGSFFAPVASAGPLGFFGTANLRTVERTNRVAARNNGALRVHGSRVLVAPGCGLGCGVGVHSFGTQTIIIR